MSAIRRRATLESHHGYVSRRDSALEAALEQLGAPVFVLSPDGHIRETNVAARERLAADASMIGAALDDLVHGSDPGLPFELTRLDRDGELVGWLAIERQPQADGIAAKRLRIQQAAQRWSLTRRQEQVLSLMAAGATNARIAATLNISERTAEDHVAAVLLRSGVGTRMELLSVLLE